MYQEKLPKWAALFIQFRCLNEICICMQIPSCFTWPWARCGEQRFDTHCCLFVRMKAQLVWTPGPWTRTCSASLGGGLLLCWLVFGSCSGLQCHDKLQPLLIICCHLAPGHWSETNERSHFFLLCCYNTSLRCCRQKPYYKLFYSVMLIMPPLLSLQHRTSR